MSQPGTQQSRSPSAGPSTSARLHGASSRVAGNNHGVPRLSAFYGIVITMYWRDHPPPHFHADYSGYAAKIEIETLQVIEGFVPPRALRLTGEWAELHRDELRDNWARAVSHDALVPIDPLQ